MEIDKNIKNLPYLSKTALVTSLGKNPNTLKNWISYWTKKGSLIQLKRGFYVFKDFLDKNDNSLYYSKFLATKMIEPSYLSLEFILQDYQIMTDIVYNYSIVTTKKTNSISNKFGVFNYQSIKKELFIGFKKKSYGAMSWYEATKAKALFDYFYFNQNKFSQISQNELEGLRLNLEIMKASDWQEYKKYLKFAPPKMLNIYNLIQSYVI